MSESPKPPVARVVVGVGDSPGCLTVLGRAANEARLRGAELWPVVVWEPPEGDPAARRFPATSALVPEWERLAGERLAEALRDAFGDAGTGLPGRALVVRGAPGPALVRVADRDGDLLVVGAAWAGPAAPRAVAVGRPPLPRPRRLPCSRGPALPAAGGTDGRAPPQHPAAAPGHR
ncbi:universal stress protein [Streptomyces sp. LN245]|uniref:universal stress protein n=1 Tax=Streptomyces sp. LN245 TaxID=3112975 RepID=UPI00371170C2